MICAQLKIISVMFVDWRTSPLTIILMQPDTNDLGRVVDDVAEAHLSFGNAMLRGNAGSLIGQQGSECDHIASPWIRSVAV
jgi:hypothetical protein